MPSTLTTGDNKFGVAKWIVDPVAGNGTHTTIAGALASASSGDTIFIRPGTYTENLGLVAGVNLTAFASDANTPTVTIIGKCTASFAGACSIGGVRLQTNSDYFLVVSGNSATVVNVTDCSLNCSNNTGISYTSSSASSKIYISHCFANLGTTGIGLYSMSSTGSMQLYYVDWDNTGSSLTVSSNSAGNVLLRFCDVSGVLSTTLTGTVTGESCTEIGVSALNTVSFTSAGTGSSSFHNCKFQSGTAACVSIGSGTTVTLKNCVFDSTNTNPVTGAGTLNSTPLSFLNTGILCNVAGTITDYAFGRKGTWSPVIAFGGSSTGVTYSSREGTYWVVGKIVYFYVAMVLTNNGSGTGTATISIPFTSVTNQTLPLIIENLDNEPAGTDQYMCRVMSGTATLQMLAVDGTSTLTYLTNSYFGNTSGMSCSGFFFTA